MIYFQKFEGISMIKLTNLWMISSVMRNVGLGHWCCWWLKFLF